MANVGQVDRIIRIVLGVLIVAWSFSAGNLWWILGAALIATGIFRYCGLYRVLGVSTCKQTDKT
ncbi:MAG: DUF2892 domain-containing protein [Idiomarina sp.]|nr:DUF2892 domain-containing protein [Idiomarina sp.]